MGVGRLPVFGRSRYKMRKLEQISILPYDKVKPPFKAQKKLNSKINIKIFRKIQKFLLLKLFQNS